MIKDKVSNCRISAVRYSEKCYLLENDTQEFGRKNETSELNWCIPLPEM